MKAEADLSTFVKEETAKAARMLKKPKLQRRNVQQWQRKRKSVESNSPRFRID